MKWKPNPKPNSGARKVRTRFALFPVFIDGVYIWLEMYTSVLEYGEYLSDNYWYRGWHEIKKIPGKPPRVKELPK